MLGPNAHPEFSPLPQRAPFPKPGLPVHSTDPALVSWTLPWVLKSDSLNYPLTSPLPLINHQDHLSRISCYESRKTRWMGGRKERRKGSVGHYLPLSSPLGFPGGTSGREPTVREAGLILWSGRCPGGGHGNPLQYSCLENLMDRGAWQATLCRVTKSQTRLKQFSMHTHLHHHPLL